MTEREEEQPEIKVTDRRKFNLDGSLREGVEIAPEPPKEEIKSDETQSEILTSATAAAPVGNADHHGHERRTFRGNERTGF